MEQKEKPLSSMEINKIVSDMKTEKAFSEEVIALVKSDLEYGLQEEDTNLYLKPGYKIEQMKVLSECLRKGISEELTSLLRDNALSGHQMQVSLEFYEKGVPIEAIRDVVARGDTAVAMRSAYSKLLESVEKAKEAVESEPEYIKDLIAQMEEVVKKIHYQDERYDALNKKLAVFETSKDDEEIRNRLVKENEDKDATISFQQDELNKANGTIARLRDEVEKKEKEMGRMRDRIESLEDKIMNIASDNERETEGQSQEDDKKTTADSRTIDSDGPQTRIPEPSLIPVYYQIPVVDGAGRVVQKQPIERADRKSSGKGMAALFSRLCFKKKSRADIVKLVASGDLAPAQLVQIKSAIEKGLTEDQLVELINNNVSAEKMKEIIEIAVLENSMAY